MPKKLEDLLPADLAKLSEEELKKLWLKHQADEEDETPVSSGKTAMARFKKRINFNADEEDDPPPGTSSLSVEEISAWLRVMLKKQIREGQRAFGSVPMTEDPDSVFNKRNQQGGYGERPHPHPLLAESSQFSGIDPSHNPSPVDNNESSEKYQQDRLENQLRNQAKLTKAMNKSYTSAPRFNRT